MSYIQQMEDISDLVMTLIKSTCLYTKQGIPNDKDRYAYIRAMRLCYYLCSKECNGLQLNRMLDALLKLKKDAPKSFAPRFQVVSDVKKHYMLGVNQCIDIVSTISQRFVEGHSSPEKMFAKMRYV